MTDEMRSELEGAEKNAIDIADAMKKFGVEYDEVRLDQLLDEHERISNVPICNGNVSDESLSKARALIDEIIVLNYASGNPLQVDHAKMLSRTRDVAVKIAAKGYETELRERKK